MIWGSGWRSSQSWERYIAPSRFGTSVASSARLHPGDAGGYLCRPAGPAAGRLSGLYRAFSRRRLCAAVCSAPPRALPGIDHDLGGEPERSAPAAFPAGSLPAHAEIRFPSLAALHHRARRGFPRKRDQPGVIKVSQKRPGKNDPAGRALPHHLPFHPAERRHALRFGADDLAFPVPDREDHRTCTRDPRGK